MANNKAWWAEEPPSSKGKWWEGEPPPVKPGERYGPELPPGHNIQLDDGSYVIPRDKPLFGPNVKALTGQLANTTRESMEGVDKLMGVPRGPYQEGPNTPNNDRFQSLPPAAQAASSVMRPLARIPVGIAEFLTSVPDKVTNPDKYFPKEYTGLDVAKEEAAGLTSMITDLPAQYWDILTRPLGNKNPEQLFQMLGLGDYYKQAVNRLYEAPESAYFGSHMLKGASKIGRPKPKNMGVEASKIDNSRFNETVRDANKTEAVERIQAERARDKSGFNEFENQNATLLEKNKATQEQLSRFLYPELPKPEQTYGEGFTMTEGQMLGEPGGVTKNAIEIRPGSEYQRPLTMAEEQIAASKRLRERKRIAAEEAKKKEQPQVTTEQTPAGEQFTFGGQREVPRTKMKSVGKKVETAQNQADVFSPNKTAPGKLPQDQLSIPDKPATPKLFTDKSTPDIPVVADKGRLETMRDMFKDGASQKYSGVSREADIGTGYVYESRGGQFSNYPFWSEQGLFDRGYTSKQLADITQKAIDGKKLTEKQYNILNEANDLLNDYLIKDYENYTGKSATSKTKKGIDLEPLPFGVALTATAAGVLSDDEEKGLVGAGLGLMFGIKKGKTFERVKESSGREYGRKHGINIDKLGVSDKAKVNAASAVDALSGKLEKKRGKKLSLDDIAKKAKEGEKLGEALDRKATERFTAALYNNYRLLAKEAEKPGISKEFWQNAEIVASAAADAGRTLGSFRLTKDPVDVLKNQVVKDLQKLGIKYSEIAEAGKGVDWNSQKQVTEFYRKFVKPTFSQVLDEYVYANLLSSMKTHAVNATSNAIQAGILLPSTKTVAGGYDWIAANLRGRERQMYMSEVPAYYKGLFNSVGDAYAELVRAMKGETAIERPDLTGRKYTERLPTNHPAVKWTYPIPRFLEGMDRFFRTMMEGAEMEAAKKKAELSRKPFDIEKVEIEAAKTAEEYVFRGKLDPKNEAGQGYLLSGIDAFTNFMIKGREIGKEFKKGEGNIDLRFANPVRWYVRFITTPMNIVKQGIQYSPAGLMTIPGSHGKARTLNAQKAFIGSTVTAVGAHLALQGKTTWAAPNSPKERKAFYDAGMQPYSIKIGDKWISYSKLGPLSYPLAIPAAVRWHYHDNPKAYSESELDKMMGVLGAGFEFFSDQSYVKGIGELIGSMSDPDRYLKKMATNIPRQLIPLSALQNQINSAIDGTYRDPQDFVDEMQKGIVGLSENVPPHTNSDGQPSLRESPVINSVSPFQFRTEKPYQAYKLKQLRTKMTYDTEYRKIYDLIKEKKYTEAKESIRQWNNTHSKKMLPFGVINRRVMKNRRNDGR